MLFPMIQTYKQTIHKHHKILRSGSLFLASFWTTEIPAPGASTCKMKKRDGRVPDRPHFATPWAIKAVSDPPPKQVVLKQVIECRRESQRAGYTAVSSWGPQTRIRNFRNSSWFFAISVRQKNRPVWPSYQLEWCLYLAPCAVWVLARVTSRPELHAKKQTTQTHAHDTDREMLWIVIYEILELQLTWTRWDGKVGKSS